MVDYYIQIALYPKFAIKECTIAMCFANDIEWFFTNPEHLPQLLNAVYDHS